MRGPFMTGDEAVSLEMQHEQTPAPRREPVDVLCVGCVAVDVIASPVRQPVPTGQLAFVDDIVVRPGGCALNTASGLAALGLRAGFAGRLGDDSFADVVEAALAARGVEASAVRAPGEGTASSMLLVDEDGSRTILHNPGATRSLSDADIAADLGGATRALHVGGALLLGAFDGEPCARLLMRARGDGLFTSLDPAWDPSGRWQLLLASLPHLDLCTPSLDEGRAISGCHEPADIAAWFRARGVGAVAITMGRDGCHVSSDGFEGALPAFAVDTVDETGAGDAFVSGLLYGMLAGWDLEDAARLGSATGALASTVVGASERSASLHEAMALASSGGNAGRTPASSLDGSAV